MVTRFIPGAGYIHSEEKTLYYTRDRKGKKGMGLYESAEAALARPDVRRGHKLYKQLMTRMGEGYMWQPVGNPELVEKEG